MTIPAVLQNKLSLPVIGSPLFIISNPAMVIAQCKAGIVGSFPSLNARGEGEFERWLIDINEQLDAHNAANPDSQAAPYAVNLIVHRSNPRIEEDLMLCVKYKVPVIITSLGAREDVINAIHSYGGIVIHDIINQFFAKKAISKGADGLIAVAAGAGGHAGTLSPFALIQEIRQWYDGLVLLSGSIASGEAVLAAQAMGADLAYIGSAFIATQEANASSAYKQMIVDSSGEDIVYSNLFSGVHGNYLKGSVVNSGFDPDNLPEGDVSTMDFAAATSDQSSAKAWKDIWGCGQGIGVVDKVSTIAERVEQLKAEYQQAKQKLLG